MGGRILLGDICLKKSPRLVWASVKRLWVSLQKELLEGVGLSSLWLMTTSSVEWCNFTLCRDFNWLHFVLEPGGNTKAGEQAGGNPQILPGGPSLGTWWTSGHVTSSPATQGCHIQPLPPRTVLMTHRSRCFKCVKTVSWIPCRCKS